jgi:hypothetical protein
MGELRVSCVIVNNKIMSVVANLLSRMLNTGFDSFGFEIKDELKAAFKNCYCNGCYSAKKIYERLYELNFKAYNERYGECEWTTFETFMVDKQNQMLEIDVWEHRAGDDHARTWHYQAIRCLQEVHYQLCEGKIYDCAETKAIGQLIGSFAIFIVTHTKEYDDNWIKI